MPPGTDVALVEPIFTVTEGATVSPASGASAGFTPANLTVTYTVTAQDLSTKDYAVTVKVLPPPPSATTPVLWLDASQLDGLSDGQQVDSWTDMSGLWNHATRTDGSPVYKPGVINGKPVVRFDSGSFQFNRISTIRTVFWVVKENPGAKERFLLGEPNSSDFHRDLVGPNSPPWSQWSHNSVKNGTTKLMGNVINGLTTNLPAGTFQLLSVVTTGNVQASTISNDRSVSNRSWNGDIAEILIYDKALTAAEELQVGSYLTVKYGLTTYTPQANLLSFSFAAIPSVIDQATKALTIGMPYGADVTNLTPVYTLSMGATCDKPWGSSQNFTNPVTYTVTSGDSKISNTYTVTVKFSPKPPGTTAPAPVLWLDASQLVGLSDGQQVNSWTDISGLGNNANLAEGSPVYRPGVINGKPVVRFDSGSLLFDRISTIRSVFWVVKEKPGAIGRFPLGDQSAFDFHRGGGANGTLWDANYANVNILDGTTRLMGNVIDGTATNLPAGTFQLISLVTTDAVQANTVSNDRTIANRSWNGDIAEILIYDQELTPAQEAEVGNYLTAKYALTTYTPQANLLSFSLAGRPFVIDQATKALTLTVPYTDVTNLVPTYTMSDGATCDKPSGSGLDFTNPVTFTVTSADSNISNTYTVTFKTAPKPPSATAPVLWLDASQLTGLSNGQQVDSWPNVSGSGNNANRTEGSPVYKQGIINGKPVVRFNTGSFQFNRISTIRTVFWVLKENIGAKERFLLGDTNYADFHRDLVGPNSPPWSQWSSDSVKNGTTKLMGNVINGLTTNLPAGTFQLLSVVTTGNVQASTISNDRSVSNRSWNGDIAEILIYDQALSTAEEVEVGLYLATKYGLTTGYDNDYSSWLAAYPGFDLANPAGDADKDGLTNQQEYAFGLNPTLGSSVNPISVPLERLDGTFSYTRRNPALTNLAYTVWTSTNLVDWTQDAVATAGQTVTATSGDVQTVAATLTAQPVSGKLFVRVKAE